MAPVTTHPDDIIILGSDTESLARGFYAQRRCYAGDAGVFADLAHQQPSSVPMGGDIDYRPGKAMYLRLRSAGSDAGCLFDGAATLLDRRTLDIVLGHPSGMVADSFYVAREAWPARIGTTLRIDHVTRPIRSQVEGDAERSVKVAAVNLGMLLMAETGNRELATAARKLDSVCRQAGRNAKAALAAGAGLFFDENSDDNVLMSGLPLDFASYCSVNGWYQLGGLVFRYLVDLHRLARASLVTTQQFFANEHAAHFFREFLPIMEVPKICALGKSLFGDVDGKRAIEVLDTKEYLTRALRIASEATAAWILPRLNLVGDSVSPTLYSVRSGELIRHFTENDKNWRSLELVGAYFPAMARGAFAEAIHVGRQIRVRHQVSGLSGEQSPEVITRLLLRVFAVHAVRRCIPERDNPEHWDFVPPLLGFDS